METKTAIQSSPPRPRRPRGRRIAISTEEIRADKPGLSSGGAVLAVECDLPAHVPVTDDEMTVLFRYARELLDELMGS